MEDHHAMGKSTISTGPFFRNLFLPGRPVSLRVPRVVGAHHGWILRSDELFCVPLRHVLRMYMDIYIFNYI